MADQFIGKVLADKYQINSLISKGNLGNLYHGTHLLMEKPVMVKILPSALAVDEKIVDNFAKEARTVSRISHPNILSVTDYGSDKDNTVFIVYEDANGENLRESIDRVGRFTLGRANKVVKEVASALTLAHNNGIIHQNLSSENILVNQDGVKVLNFGTSTFDINDLDYPIEKIEYLAPEQCAVSGEIDERSDIYALGIILFEMLAGEVPFTASNGTDLMLKQTQEPPPPINAFRRDLPNEVDDILLTALAKNPTIRYQSAQEFADALNQVAIAHPDPEEMAFSPIPPANAIVTPEASNNNIWKTAFIVLAGTVLLGAFFVYMTQSKQTDPKTALQNDANGMPVQPINPASGTTEQGLSNMDSFNPAMYSNSNSIMTDGGGVSNPYWENGQRPPGMPSTTTGGYGDPYPVPQGIAPPGNQVYIDPGNGSIFMPQDDGSYVVMKPKNANADTNVNANVAQKKNSNSNVNTQPTANTTTGKPPANTAPANTATPKVSPTPATTTPKPKTTNPTDKPKTEPTKPPAATDKRPVSGKNQDTF
ncbi:MAG TPA: protein kinase [Pyrinomonadaceae bacterium]|nr:protein kinase [Pyrinomonadaceae bacterium]